ncbi:hypothetical protein [Cryobacterium sp. MLB-32]|uniref:hypothetical protein n=1 Tax=Cryobacterium sp. MLB-32 TaxID=1529318 RepID=UPI00068AD27C|nr:hypothetical protein [Cryobacterium sp. MLB-32]
MKVIVSRSGGLADIRLTWEVRIDEQPDATSWADFLLSLPWSEVTDSEPVTGSYLYRIRCAPFEVVLVDARITGEWRELVDRVQAANGSV